jgi:hypothetical protein
MPSDARSSTASGARCGNSSQLGSPRPGGRISATGPSISWKPTAITSTAKQGRIAAEIAAIEDDIGDKAFKAVAYPEGSVARRKFDEYIAEREEEVRAKRASLVPLDRRLDAAVRQLDEINATIKAVRGHASSRRMRQAAELLRAVLREIVVHSTDNPIKGGSSPDRVAERIVFIPVIGEPIAFGATPPKGAVSVAALARARELWREGHNLNRIAGILTAEGLPKPGGPGAWRRRAVVRLLAAEIASEGPRDGRCRPHLPTRPDASDGPR